MKKSEFADIIYKGLKDFNDNGSESFDKVTCFFLDEEDMFKILRVLDGDDPLEDDTKFEDEHPHEEWVSFTPESFATKEDWETVCDTAYADPETTSKIKIYVSKVEVEDE